MHEESKSVCSSDWGKVAALPSKPDKKKYGRKNVFKPINYFQAQ